MAFIVEIFINLTYVFFNFQLFMMVKIVFAWFVYFPVVIYLYERANQEFLVGINKLTDVKVRQEIKDKQERVNNPDIYIFESREDDEKDKKF